MKVTWLNGAKAQYDADLKFEFDAGHWKKNLKKGFFAFTIFRVIAATLLILVIIAMFHRFFGTNAGHIQKKYPTFLGYGALLFIGMPIAAGIACATIIGIPAGLILFSIFGIATLLSHTITAVVAAYEVNKVTNKNWTKQNLMLVSIGFFLLLKLMAAIPVIGSIAAFALTMIAFGYIVKTLIDKRNNPSGNDDDGVEIIIEDTV